MPRHRKKLLSPGATRQASAGGDNRPKAYSYVRMSTREQLRKGDSLRRQLEDTEKYAAENSLDLDRDLKFQDLGVSAFLGANLKGGALGKFLEAVEDGRVAKGSYLIVESLDRLSRQPVARSLNLFLDIHERGINLVSLMDKKIYPADTELDSQQLIHSIGIMARAHEESASKRERLRKAWEQKRRDASTRRMTSICPAWLKPGRGKTFVPDPGKVEVVKRIFELSASGLGILAISKRLNKEGVKPFGRSRGWNESYIAKILNNRAVLGEMQPASQRKKLEQTYAGYYPSIISEELFSRSLLAKSERLRRGRGRRGEHQTNLFSGLLRCGFCGSTYRYLYKGAGPKGGSYLACAAAVRGQCGARSWNYSDFETSLLTFVEEIDIATVFRQDTFSTQLNAMNEKLQLLQARKIQLTQQRDNIRTAIQYGTSDTIKVLTLDLNAAEERLRDNDVELVTTLEEKNLLQDSARQTSRDKNEIKDAIRRLQSEETPEIFPARAKLSGLLHNLIEYVDVWFGDNSVFREREAALLKDAGLDPSRALIPKVEVEKNFSVHFKNGAGIRGVGVAMDDPTKFLRQTVSNSQNQIVNIRPDGSVEPLVVSSPVELSPEAELRADILLKALFPPKAK